MKKKPFIFLAVCMAAIAVICIANLFTNKSENSHTDPEVTTTSGPGMVFVALQPASGLIISGDNPVSIVPGDNVSFTVSTDEKHYIMESDSYTYENGVINFGPIDSASTLYVSLGQYYEVDLAVEGEGQAILSEKNAFKAGDSVCVELTPAEGYRLKSIRLNGIYQQESSDSTFIFTLEDNAKVEIAYEEIPAPPRTVFNVYIMDGEEAGLFMENLAPGTSVELPLGDADALTSGEYNVIGYNTAADYSGEYYAFGSVFVMGNEDIILYPQKYKYADASDFTGKIINSRYLIQTYIGTPVDGVICIPAYIEGVPVTDIRPDAFKDISGLTTVIFPVGMRKLENGTINNCPDFTTLVLPQTMESVSSKAVTACPNFKNLRVIGTLEHRFTDSFDAALADKFLRLQATEGKRIIVVAGSSTSFGLTSQLLMDAFPDYTVINFGSSYLSGMNPALQLLSPFVREGDIVIFAPEYYASTYAAEDADSNCLWYSIESNLNMLNYLDVSQYPILLDRFTSAMYLIRNSIATDKLPYSNAEYMLRHNFNEYGDLASVRPANNTKVFSTISNKLVNTRGMTLINSYIDDFAARGVTCLFSFPPVYIKKLNQTYTDSVDAHLAKLSTSLSPNCTIISNPLDYSFTENLFYDNFYHTTLEGANRRTEQLIKDLKAYLED